jgi:hypothetical protein
LHVQNSNVVRSKEKSVEAKNRDIASKNRIRKKETFENFIFRVSSQFEFVQKKMIESMNENLNEDVTRVLAQVDSTSRRRKRSRESERTRDKESREDREDREKDRESLSRDKTTGTFERVKIEADHYTPLKMRPHHVIPRLAHLAFLQFVRLDR